MNTMYLTPVVGALIGYFTNWLAIKMVFRPHTEKRVFGVKVPFTPGLIAVERDRITEQIGYVVSNHLLTDDDLKDKILELDFDFLINKTIQNIVDDLNNSNLTIEEFLKSILKDDFDENVDQFKKLINANISNSIKRDKTDYEMCLFEQDLRLAIPEVLLIIKKIFEDDMYDVDKLLKTFFDNIIGTLFSGLGAFFSGFISSDTIYNALKNKVITSINEEPKEIEDSLVNAIINSENNNLDSFKFDNMIDVATNNMLSIKLNSLTPMLNLFKTEKMISSITLVVKTFISNEINDILKNIDINKLIVKKINEMPLIEIEKLILSIAKKEITAITNIGGVLGFIIGLASVVFIK